MDPCLVPGCDRRHEAVITRQRLLVPALHLRPDLVPQSCGVHVQALDGQQGKRRDVEGQVSACDRPGSELASA